MRPYKETYNISKSTYIQLEKKFVQGTYIQIDPLGVYCSAERISIWDPLHGKRGKYYTEYFLRIWTPKQASKYLKDRATNDSTPYQGTIVRLI